VPPPETSDATTPAVLWPFVRSGRKAQPVLGPPEDILVRIVYAPAAGPSASTAAGRMVTDRPWGGPIIGSIVWTDGTPGGVTVKDLLDDGTPDGGWLLEVTDMASADDVRGRETRTEYVVSFFRRELPPAGGA
jgi:hypothetical protein